MSDTVFNIVVFMGFLVAYAFLKAVVAYVWYWFRWRVLGWRPRIYFKEKAEEAAKAVGDVCIENDEARNLSDEEAEELRKEFETLAHDAILRYTELIAKGDLAKAK
jgi:hypothetical protein